MTVLREGQPLGGATTQPRRLAILALLAEAGERGVSRDKVLAFLWPDLDETRGRRVLAQAVYALRRDMGSAEAIRGGRELRFDPDDVQSDLAAFRDALAQQDWERAAGIYDGPFLDGYHLPGAPELERWVDEQRADLAHRYADAVERAANAREEAGDLTGAVPLWRRLAAHDPHNARVALRLMRALVQAGDRTGALRHASIHAALLEQQLDLPPDPEVQAYAEEVRSATLDARTASPAARPDPTPAATPIDTEAASIEHPESTRELNEPDRVATAQSSDAGKAARSGYRTAMARGSARAARLVPARLRPLLARTAWLIGMAAAITLVTLLITLALRPRPTFDPDWVIVAPLENRTRDPALDDVGIMAAEWVTQGLARTGLVQVVDAQTMIALAREVAGAGRPIRALAERTGAGTVISGSYYADGGRLRFQMQITDARTGRLVRDIDAVTAPTDRPTEALEPLRERVTGALAVLRDDRLGNATAVASQPPLYPAYQEFLLGMASFGDDYAASIRHFTRSAALDPTFGQALLWAGQSMANVSDYTHADSIFRILDRDRLRLPPYDQANFDYFYLGFVRGDWNGAYEGARRMVELAPTAPHALFALGTTATIENRPAEALRALDSIDIDHGWGRDWALRVLTLRGRAYHELGDHEHELVEARRLREREPNMGWTRIPEIRALAALGRLEELGRAVDAGLSFPPTPRTWEAYSAGELLNQAGRELSAHGHSDLAMKMWERAVAWYRDRGSLDAAGTSPTGLADALLAAGRLDDARAECEALIAQDTLNSSVLGSLGVIAARQNRVADARAMIAVLESDHRPWTFGRPALALARIHAALGDTEAAVRDIRDARRAGYARIYFIHLEPEFEPLRSFPPWRSLLEPVTGSD